MKPQALFGYASLGINVAVASRPGASSAAMDSSGRRAPSNKLRVP